MKTMPLLALLCLLTVAVASGAETTSPVRLPADCGTDTEVDKLACVTHVRSRNQQLTVMNQIDQPDKVCVYGYGEAATLNAHMLPNTL